MNERSLFLSGIKPQAFATMLENRKDNIESLEHMKLAVFAQNIHSTRHRPQKLSLG
jgi:hypothetical protein